MKRFLKRRLEIHLVKFFHSGRLQWMVCVLECRDCSSPLIKYTPWLSAQLKWCKPRHTGQIPLRLFSSWGTRSTNQVFTSLKEGVMTFQKKWFGGVFTRGFTICFIFTNQF